MTAAGTRHEERATRKRYGVAALRHHSEISIEPNQGCRLTQAEGGQVTGVINDYTGRRIIEVDTKGKVVTQWRTGSRTIVASIDLVR